MRIGKSGAWPTLVPSLSGEAEDDLLSEWPYHPAQGAIPVLVSCPTI